MNRTAAPEGLLELRFARAPTGRTELVRRVQRFPLHLTTPLYLDPRRPDMAFVYVQNPTGGVFAGDRLATRISAGSSTALHVTTTAATKIYRSEEGGARHLTVIDVGAGAYVEHLPEPLIPQAGSRYEQETVVELDDRARLVVAETVAPGRTARGERFQFDRLRLATTIRSRGVDVCREAVVLEPSRQRPARRGMLGRYSYVGTLFAVAPSFDADELAQRLDAAVCEVGGTLGAAGVLPSDAGAFVRVLAESSREVSYAMSEAWCAARELLLGQRPPARRRK